MKADFPASRNRLFLLGGFFLLVVTATETSGSQLEKKEHILTHVTDFLAGGTHFLSFSQATVNYCHWKQFILQLEHVLQPILHIGLWKLFYCLLETVLFYSEFFQLVETIVQTWEISIFKDEIYSC